MNTRCCQFLAVALSCILFSVLARGAEAAPAKEQTTCPVSNKAIDKKYYADRDGCRIFFCSAACIEKFKKDPERYLAALKKQGVTLSKIPPPQSFCPPCGMTIDRAKSQHVDAGGYRFYSCSGYCSKKMQSDPEKYAQMIRNKGQEPEKAPPADAPSRPQSPGKK